MQKHFPVPEFYFFSLALSGIGLVLWNVFVRCKLIVSLTRSLLVCPKATGICGWKELEMTVNDGGKPRARTVWLRHDRTKEVGA